MPRLSHQGWSQTCLGTLVARGLTCSKAVAGLRVWSPVILQDARRQAEMPVALLSSDRAPSWLLQRTEGPQRFGAP